MNPVYTAIERNEVISYLGRGWPPRSGEPSLTIPPDTGITDGAATVYPDEGRPGTTWWVVDSTIPQQDAGVPDEALAALLPGSVLGTAPNLNPGPDTPPIDTDSTYTD
ncbi:hypothetical protein [Streptomyces sp. NPDC059224]|uniref:hypothetical protein n=1 Tax=Streptomyces sp. NPDC059224 TaxID=3346775 RepID=UPI0036C99430